MFIPNDTITREVAASAPPTAVAALSFAGVSLSDWVLIATLLWLGVQITWFGYNRYRDFFKKDK